MFNSKIWSCLFTDFDEPYLTSLASQSSIHTSQSLIYFIAFWQHACEQLFLRMKHWKNKIKLKIFDRLLEKSLRISTTSTEPDTVFFFLWKYCIKLKYPTSFLLLLPSFFICFKEKILKNMRCCHLPTYIKYIYIFLCGPWLLLLSVQPR